MPENRHDPNSRLIALPITRIRARSAQPGVPVFRLQGGPGVTNMEFPAASRFTDTHDVVLVGYRGVDGSSRLDCPEVGSSREHSRDLLGERSLRADAAAYRSAPIGSAAKASIWPVTPSPNASTTSTRPSRLRVSPDRPGQRKRGHAHRDDLRLALPEEHPPLGDDRRQPTGQLPLGREDNRRADPSLRGDLRPGPELSQTDTDLAASLSSSFAHVPEHWLFLPIKQSDARSRPSSARSTRPPTAAARSPAADDRQPPLGRQGRRERCVVPVAHGRSSSSRTRRSGATWPRSAAAMRPMPGASSRRGQTGGSLIGSPAASSSGRRPPPRSLARKPGRERLHRGAGLDVETLLDRR